MRSVLCAGAAAMTLVIAACGGGASQPTGSIKVTLTEYKFDPSTISVPAGKVVFFLVNAGAVSHDMIIRDTSGSRIAGSELISAGDTSVFTVDDLPAGNYTFFCDRPGHEASGMKGTLNVS